MISFQSMYSVMEYGGTHARQSDLFGTQDAVVKMTKTFFKVSTLMKSLTFSFVRCFHKCVLCFDIYFCVFIAFLTFICIFMITNWYSIGTLLHSKSQHTTV
jgi:hypothetical protein